MQPAYIVQRQVTKTILTSHPNKVMAFQSHTHAKNYANVYNIMRTNKNEQQQPLMVSEVDLQKLTQQCALNALEVCHVDKSLNLISMAPLDYPSDEYMFYLENVIWYH